VTSAQFSPDGKRILTFLDSAQFGPEGQIFTGSDDFSARVWDVQTGQPLTEPLRHQGRLNSAQFSPDGNRILTTSGSARVWNVQTGQPLTELLKDEGWVSSAQFSPDGKRIVTASYQAARVWDAQNGQLLTKALKHDGEVNSAQFSPDGKRIVTASDRNARVWDAQSGQPLTEPLRHQGRVTSAQFSPDGNRIVTASEDLTARVWDAQTGQPLTEPLNYLVQSGYNPKIVTAQFSPDGCRIVMTFGDQTAWVSYISPSPTNHPSWLPQLAEAISGQALNERGLLEPTHLDRAETINQIRQTLNQASDDDEWVQWGRSFLADTAARTISNSKKLKVLEYIENRIRENTAASLAEAESLALGNTELSERITQARKTLDQTTRAVVMQGKLAESEMKYREALEISRNVNGPEHPATLQAMKGLAYFYCSVGRNKEAIALQAKACEVNPRDTAASLTLATWQTWFGQDADYEATRRRLVQQAEGTDEAGTAERAAKAYCLRASTDAAMLAKALNLAQRGVELGKSTWLLPWYQLGLGLAEYRNGQYAAAEQTLTAAEQTVGKYPQIQATMRLYRAMSLLRQNRPEDARKLFSQAEAEMPPLPQGERKPLADGGHDVLICWLAYKEAKSLLNEPAAGKP
jgi:Tol biopolymer transport system component